MEHHTSRIYHPPGTVRLPTPAELTIESDPVANFGTRLAYPPPRRAPATGRPPSLVRRALRALLRAVDEAPFDLAWPPSPGAVVRRRAAFER
ncbi:hypothetical protein [Roseisolibacter sp. H3M3-2]|uniref:hypothetical protein n=1 Tax=Roseisolibacter sp. H3M3-2 TaxID=3031323 RepID=UPI0023DBFF7D|nr:hypothetical protein [Roseisolibacter sp. H3M3-2]MDF1504772.1 hypothetical protein [Roseisolibacter sp. H3M3-2]